MTRWPRDNQSALIKFYGTPGPEVAKRLVPVVPPFRMYYDGVPIKNIRFHKLAAPALKAALDEIWDYYGQDQRKIDALGISKYAGAYNHRKIRGSATKWSNHSYGAAIDLNAEDNGFGKGKGTIPQPVIDAFKRQGARWGGDYKGRTDPMHFEFCDNGGQVVPPLVAPPAQKVGLLATVKESKIAKVATVVGAAEAGDILSTVNNTAGQVASLKGSADQIGITEWLVHLATNPRFLIAVATLVGVGFILYWRWKDHA